MDRQPQVEAPWCGRPLGWGIISAMELTLSGVEARVLGALVEKEITTPDYYPLSLNALIKSFKVDGKENSSILSEKFEAQNFQYS